MKTKGSKEEKKQNLMVI